KLFRLSREIARSSVLLAHPWTASEVETVLSLLVETDSGQTLQLVLNIPEFKAQISKEVLMEESRRAVSLGFSRVLSRLMYAPLHELTREDIRLLSDEAVNSRTLEQVMFTLEKALDRAQFSQR